MPIPKHCTLKFKFTNCFFFKSPIDYSFSIQDAIISHYLHFELQLVLFITYTVFGNLSFLQCKGGIL